MKGIVFNVVQDVVESRGGPDLWDEVVAAAGVDAAYTSLGTYADADLGALAVAVADRLHMPVPDAVRMIGRDGFASFANHSPELLEGHDSVFSVLLALNDIIHPEVLKLYPGSRVPSFTVVVAEPGHVDLVYESERGLCVLAEGLAEGAAAHFGENVSVTQPECRHRHDERCLVRVVAEDS